MLPSRTAETGACAAPCVAPAPSLSRGPGSDLPDSGTPEADPINFSTCLLGHAVHGAWDSRTWWGGWRWSQSIKGDGSGEEQTSTNQHKQRASRRVVSMMTCGLSQVSPARGDSCAKCTALPLPDEVAGWAGGWEVGGIAGRKAEAHSTASSALLKAVNSHLSRSIDLFCGITVSVIFFL